MGILNNQFGVMVNMPDAAHKTSIFNGLVGLIRRVKRRIRQLGTAAGCGVNALSDLQNPIRRPDKTRQRRIRHFGSKVLSQRFSYLLVQIAREIFQSFQLFQRRAHFLLTFGIITFQANQRFNQA